MICPEIEADAGDELVIADDHERRLHAIESGRATALPANAVDIEDIC